jgi:hypothetical protein
MLHTHKRLRKQICHKEPIQQRKSLAFMGEEPVVGVQDRFG